MFFTLPEKGKFLNYKTKLRADNPEHRKITRLNLKPTRRRRAKNGKSTDGNELMRSKYC